MAYLVSQLRKNGNQTYMNPISVEGTTINSPSPFEEGALFEDFALTRTDIDVQGKLKKFTSNQVYYLRFQIHKIPEYFYSGSKTKQEVSMYKDADILNLKILLKNKDQDDEINNPPEVIGTCFVPTAVNNGNSEQYSSFAFVFSPSKTFDSIGFRVNRVSFDAINFNNQGYRTWLTDVNYDVRNATRQTGGETTQVTTTGSRIKYGGSEGTDTQDSGDMSSLVNIIPNKASSGFLKFGYQSRPGSLIVVNGEPIRVGRSGIYEINNGTIIKSFMIASPNGSDNKNIDAFLLDYAYKS